MTDKIHKLLDFWFGHLGSADLPTSDRTTLWFGESEEVRQKLLESFNDEFEEASSGTLADWAETPRGRLALIILLDQFPRYIHRRSSLAFAFDQIAQELCAEGLRNKMDQSLTLIERVFFYMPLVHSEETRIRTIHSPVSGSGFVS